MTNEQKAALLAYKEECDVKLAALPTRIEAEKAQAQKDNRKPFPIVPLIEVEIAKLALLVAAIKDDPEDMAVRETVNSWRNTCEKHTDPTSIRCDQFVAVLALAKIGGK